MNWSGVFWKVLGSFLAIIGSLGIAEAEDHYSPGDRVTIVVGYEPGGGYDLYARMIAPLLSKHLPGHPQVIIQNMPGAGSMQAANYMYNIARADGTVLGMIGEDVPLLQVLGQPNIHFDAEKFSWIGRIDDNVTLIGVWHTAPVKNIEDTRQNPVTIAVGGALSGSVLFVSALNDLYGTKLRPVAGYSVDQARLAMERGEVDGCSSLVWSVMKAEYPDWIRNNKSTILVQVGQERLSDLPQVPLLSELGQSDDGRKIMEVLSSGNIIGRSLLAPPNMPAARLATLRQAFSDAMNDPEAVALAAKMQLDLRSLSGDGLEAIVHQYDTLSPGLVQEIRRLAGVEKNG